MVPGFTQRGFRATSLRRHELLAEVTRAHVVGAHVAGARSPCPSLRHIRPDLRRVRAFLARFVGQQHLWPDEFLAPPFSL